MLEKKKNELFEKLRFVIMKLCSRRTWAIPISSEVNGHAQEIHIIFLCTITYAFNTIKVRIK